MGVIQVDQNIAKKCYAESIKLRKIRTPDIKVRGMNLGVTSPGEIYKGEEASSPTSEEFEG